jgi:hypothetical protein
MLARFHYVVEVRSETRSPKLYAELHFSKFESLCHIIGLHLIGSSSSDGCGMSVRYRVAELSSQSPWIS